MAFIVEKHVEGKFTLLVSLASIPGVGTLKIVSREKIQQLEVPMKDVLGTILNWGAGTARRCSKEQRAYQGKAGILVTDFGSN